jgi:hypothetical protein
MNKQIDALINAKQRIDILMNLLQVNNQSKLVEELETAVDDFQKNVDARLDYLLNNYSDIYGLHIKTNEQSKPFQ